MSLMNLVRSIGALALAWTVLAIGLGAAGVRLPVPDTAATLVRESPSIDVLPASWPKGEGEALLDRRDGRLAPIRLPRDGSWSLVGVSPWRTPGAELEAVGRWVRLEDADFCGWGVFRPSDGRLLGRVATEVLPTGRPCWIPGDPRTILFPAGDGRLYRCRLSRGDDETTADRQRSPGSGRVDPSEPLVWETPPPGPGAVFLADPFWPDLPRAPKWIVATLRQWEQRRGRLTFGPARVWWLELSDDGGAIRAAGPLTARAQADTPSGVIEHRFPNVAVGPDGGIRLVYLERRGREHSWRLRSAAIELDERTGRPAVVGVAAGPGPDPDLPSAPLLVSTDGSTVYGLLRSGGLAALPAGGSAGRTGDR